MVTGEIWSCIQMKNKTHPSLSVCHSVGNTANGPQCVRCAGSFVHLFRWYRDHLTTLHKSSPSSALQL